MDRLFLDANILFSAAYRPNAGLLAFWKLDAVALSSSKLAVAEARINLPESAQKQRLTRLVSALELFDAAPHTLIGHISLPEKDVPILLAAIVARATHLITGDLQHFGPHFGKRVGGILIQLPSAYLRKRQPR
jgi:uncharacterized protein